MEPLTHPPEVSFPKDSLRVCCQPKSVGKPRGSLPAYYKVTESEVSFGGGAFPHQDGQWDWTRSTPVWSRAPEPLLWTASLAQDALLGAHSGPCHLPQKMPRVLGLPAIKSVKALLVCSGVMPRHSPPHPL